MVASTSCSAQSGGLTTSSLRSLSTAARLSWRACTSRCLHHSTHFCACASACMSAGTDSSRRVFVPRAFTAQLASQRSRRASHTATALRRTSSSAFAKQRPAEESTELIAVALLSSVSRAARCKRDILDTGPETLCAHLLTTLCVSGLVGRDKVYRGYEYMPGQLWRVKCRTGRIKSFHASTKHVAWQHGAVYAHFAPPPGSVCFEARRGPRKGTLRLWSWRPSCQKHHNRGRENCRHVGGFCNPVLCDAQAQLSTVVVVA
jgi:hypothetical protein